MDDVYKSIEEYNPNKNRKILFVFDDMIAYMLSNKNLNPIVTELFIRGRNLNISLVLLRNLILLCKKCTAKPYSFLVIDATLASDNSSRFRKNLLERIQKLIIAIDDKFLIFSFNF